MDRITSRAVIGEFYNQLEQDAGLGWVNAIGMPMNSDQLVEEYGWIGASPSMREWVGGRSAHQMREFGLTVRNRHFEATMDVNEDDHRRDKSGQIMIRVGELADRANAHWAQLMAPMILQGDSLPCYDSQYFFDTDHEEGDSGAQSNKIDVDISALPAEVHGSTTAPTVEEARGVVEAGITQLGTIKDDQGEPMNEMASNFLVITPSSLQSVYRRAVENPLLSVASETALNDGRVNIRVASSPRFNTWTTKVALFRTDARTKPFILQSETGVRMKAKAEGSEYAFDNGRYQYGIDAWREVAFGYWQQACLLTMI